LKLIQQGFILSAQPVGVKRRSRYRSPVAPGDGTGIKSFALNLTGVKKQ